MRRKDQWADQTCHQSRTLFLRSEYYPDAIHRIRDGLAGAVSDHLLRCASIMMISAAVRSTSMHPIKQPRGLPGRFSPVTTPFFLTLEAKIFCKTGAWPDAFLILGLIHNL